VHPEKFLRIGPATACRSACWAHREEEGRGGSSRKKKERKVGACECGGVSVGIYSLSVLDVDGSSVKHYRIRQLSDGGCYISPRQRCTSIEQLVQHYSGEFLSLYTYSIAPRLLQSLQDCSIAPCRGSTLLYASHVQLSHFPPLTRPQTGVVSYRASIPRFWE